MISNAIPDNKFIQQKMEIEDEAKVDLTGGNQHGFKRIRSTKTAGIARGLDQENFAMMTSLDLSSAFDLVNAAVY